MWWFGSSRLVSTSGCADVWTELGSGGVGSEQPIWSCVLDLWPKQHWQKEPQCFSFCWAALPSLQDCCFLWAPTQQQCGWSGGCVGIQPGQLIHSDRERFQTISHHAGHKGRAAGWGGGDFTIQQMLRSWVGIGLLVPADGCCIICLFIFSCQLLHCLYISTIKFFLLLYFWLAAWSHWEGMSKWLCGDWPASQDQSSPLYHGLLNASQIPSPMSCRP